MTKNGVQQTTKPPVTVIDILITLRFAVLTVVLPGSYTFYFRGKGGRDVDIRVGATRG